MLWSAIQSLETLDVQIIIYAHAQVLPLELLLVRIKEQFNLDIVPTHLRLIRLYTWPLLEAKRYPRITLLAQSLGSIIPGLEALIYEIPDVYVGMSRFSHHQDTVGFAFTYPLAWIFWTKIMAYVHYPTISTDMLQKVKDRVKDYNNSGTISSSPTLSHVKWIYYKLFAFLYGITGLCVTCIMVRLSRVLINTIDKFFVDARAHSTHLAHLSCHSRVSTL